MLFSSVVHGQSYIEEYQLLINDLENHSQGQDLGVDLLIERALQADSVIQAASIARKFSIEKYKIEDYTSAIVYGNKEISIFERKNIKSIIYSQAVFNTAFFYRALSQDNKALNIYQKVIDLNIDPNKVGRSYNDIAIILENQGSYFEAINYFEKALAIFNEHHIDKELYNTYINIARTYELIETPESQSSEFEYMNKALKLSESKSLRNLNLTPLFNKLANYYSTEEVFDFNKAAYYFRKSLIIASQKNDSIGLSKMYRNLGNLHAVNEKETGLESYDSIKYYLDKSSQFQSQKNSGTSVNTYRIYYNHAILHKDYIAAFDYNHKALEACINSNTSLQSLPPLQELLAAESNHDIISILIERGDLFLENDNDQKDATEAMKSFVVADSILDHLNFTTREEKSKLFWRSHASDIYTGLVRAAHENTNTKKVLHYIEKNKAFLLKQNIKENIAKLSSPPHLRELEKNLKKTIYQVEKNSTLKNQTRDSKLFDAKLALKKFQDSLKSIYPERDLKQSDIKVLSLSEIQDSMDTNTALLSYLWNANADTEYQFGLVITKNRAKSFKIESTPANYDLINTFKDQISSPFSSRSDQEQNKKSADSVRDLLIPEKIYNSIRAYQRLIIIPDGELQNIPFEALSSYTDGKKFLIEDHIISYSYSMSFSEMNSLINRDTKQNFVALAPVTFNYDGLSVLQNSAKEVKDINDILDGHLYTNAQANKENFITKTNEARIIHLATHADGSSPPWIAFSTSKLYSKELYTYRNNAELVVLSGCETSLGKIAQGEGVMSLARGFFNSGANSVLSTLWNINDESSSQIMTSFYAHLKNGETKASSLHKAKLDYLKNTSLSQASPYYWSSFVLIGDGDTILYKQYDYTVLTLLSIILLLLGAILFYKKSKKEGNITEI